MLSEFEFMLKEEPTDIDYENNSHKYIEAFYRFTQQKVTTYQGISIDNIAKCISVGSTRLIPWEHTIYNIDFNNLTSLGKKSTSELIIPNFVEEVTSTHNDAINNIDRLKITSLVIPQSVMVIDNNTFAYYKNLISVHIQPESRLQFIGNNAFTCCEKLKNINFQNCADIEIELLTPERICGTSDIKFRF